jgi:hypothetical protein
VRAAFGVDESSASTSGKSSRAAYQQPVISTDSGSPSTAAKSDIMSHMRRAAKMRRQNEV